MDKKQVIFQQATQYDSFYLYDEWEILKQTRRLKEDFKQVEFLYSIKSNSNPKIVNTMLAQGFGADAASLTEVKLAHQYGLSRDKIQYSAPGKSLQDIKDALDLSIIIADSIEEISRLQQLAIAENKILEIGIRINPNFTLSNSAGVPSKFGIDEQQVFQHLPKWKKMNHLKIIGIHVHSRSQELHADILKGYYKRMLTLANRFQEALGYKIKFVNMGSGLGIPYSIKDKPLDTSSLGESTAKLISAFKKDLPGVRIFLETGRYAVGKSGYYITKVLDKKTSMGTTFVILSNTLNGFIRPCLAQLVTRYTTDENPMGSEPLFTAKDAFQFIALTNETEQETVTLVGNLCTATDVVAKDIPLPKLKQGDLVVITNAGSYAAVLSPTQFSSQNPPAQLFLACDGTVTDVTEKL